MNILTEIIGIFVILFTGRNCLGLGQYMHLRRILPFPWVPKLVTFQMCQTYFVSEVWALFFFYFN
jgi:hypothetical protein